LWIDGLWIDGLWIDDCRLWITGLSIDGSSIGAGLSADIGANPTLDTRQSVYPHSPILSTIRQSAIANPSIANRRFAIRNV
jgi:hypothetical protein